MPYYDFRCPDCGATISSNRPRKDRNKATYCPVCDVQMKRVYAIAGVVYKGGGWGSKVEDGEGNYGND